MSAVIVPGGPYGEVFLAYLEEAGIDVAGFLDDTPEKQNTDVRGVPVLGTTDLIEQLGSMDVD
jgi:FlaA1/EpsC-like NDP-sugar epimerase